MKGIYRKSVEKRKNRLFGFILYIFLGVVIGSFWFIHYFNKTLGPGLIRCAEDEVERLTVIVMNNSIRKYLSNHSLEDLLQIVRNGDHEIELIRYDTKVLNQFTMEITNLLENDLQYMAKGEFDKIDLSLKYLSEDYYERLDSGIVFTVSMGSVTGNGLLANIGPKIPLNLSIVGNVFSNVEAKVKDYGMNNAMIEVILKLEVSTVIHMPFLSKKVKVLNSIPITMEIIQGSIPNYYLDSTKK